MYEILTALPLFKGVTYQRISEILEIVPFHFLKYLPGETLINAEDNCTHIKFIISGAVRSTIANHDGRFKVSQTLTAPDVIAPDYLFGLATRYPNSAEAISPAGIMQVAKADYLKILNCDQIFLFNYLNLLSMNAQRGVNGILSLTSGSLEERIAYWIIALTQRQGTDIVLTCRQRDLYTLFGTPRQSFLAALNNMKEKELIDFNTTEIHFKSRQALVNLLSSSSE